MPEDPLIKYMRPNHGFNAVQDIKLSLTANLFLLAVVVTKESL